MKRFLLVLPFVLAACDRGVTEPREAVVSIATLRHASDASCTVERNVGGTPTPTNIPRGFDRYGYNRCAGIFNGTYSSWCLERGAPANCVGIYSPDKLLMKWNAEWDRGNAELWSKPPYSAWLNNEENGKTAGGSGAVWHYKYQWVGRCGADYTPLPDGGYCIWGEFEVLMDQGVDPNYAPGHLWFARANSNGYGN